MHMRKNSGFTLIEILVASGIASIIFAVGYYAIATTIATTRASTQRIRDTENARLFFMMFERDLSSASPGPGNMLKNRETLTPLAIYAHNATTNPSPIVVTESTTGISALSDIVQFYCRPDIPGVRDEMVFVRYYVNRDSNAHTLCRNAVVYDPNLAVPILPDEASSPLTLTNAPDNNSALFDNVYKLTVVFQRWNVATKQYIKESETNPPTQCDSLLVTVVFTNTFAQSALDKPNVDKSSDTYQSSLNNTYRSFSKVLSIPASFKQ